jgi:hypothetical protein
MLEILKVQFCLTYSLQVLATFNYEYYKVDYK